MGLFIETNKDFCYTSKGENFKLRRTFTFFFILGSRTIYMPSPSFLVPSILPRVKKFQASKDFHVFFILGSRTIYMPSPSFLVPFYACKLPFFFISSIFSIGQRDFKG